MEEAVVVPQTSQEFCLRWNNYHSSLISTLDSFKNEQMFVDVTLGCEGKYLVAHKMLLSACSAFFRDLIKLYPCPHPIIILPPEVRHSDMEKLLHFIYQGEQKVLRSCTDGQDSPCVGSGNINTASGSSSCGDNTGTSPKRPRLSLEASSSIATNSPASAPAAPTVSVGSSCSNSNNTSTAAASLLLDTPNTPNNTEDSAHSANESDSEMLPVKQEMVELKNCTEFETDGEPFNPDKYLAAAAETSCSSKQPPPPPGTLLPSYVPPPPIKAQEGEVGLSRVSGQQPVGGLIRRFLEECLQLPAPGPLLSAYTGLEGTPHFQLLRSVAKEWSYCRNATHNYTTMGGKSKRQRATSRLIETFENIDSLRSQLSQLQHRIILLEVDNPGTLKRICKAEAAIARKQREHQQQQQTSGGEAMAGTSSSGAEAFTPEEMDCKDIKASDRELFDAATEVMKQLRKLYFDQSRRLAVRISQLKKGRQATQERMQRQQTQMQQSYVQQTLQQQQQQQHHHQQQQQQQHHLQQQHNLQQQQMQQMQQQLQLAQEGVMLPHQLSLHHLHQPWSD
ncbi:hypothetical protein HAZT_HAZT009229 [Hyalella azteca]|uniref:BTB domain-containing protein n=1 Tax=Hyalella azteca TaxID=294128 RepID=A0A6A0HB57_HYAAZ|nr:hypothetical protein HAZT_HAZT009229 [Hyalella azteca]